MKSNFEKSFNALKGNIAGYCKRYGITQDVLAQMIGMPRSTLSNRQKNPNTYKIEELMQIAQVLHTTVGDLLT